MFWYSTIGNEIFNNTKYFTDFWLFEGNKSERMRDLSWKPGADNSKAILPFLIIKMVIREITQVRIMLRMDHSYV